MSSLSLRVLELFDDNQLSLHETEKLLMALSNSTQLNFTDKINRKKVNSVYIPPHLPSYMDSFTLEKQI